MKQVEEWSGYRGGRVPGSDGDCEHHQVIRGGNHVALARRATTRRRPALTAAHLGEVGTVYW